MSDFSTATAYRSAPSFELRAAEGDGGNGMPTMVINFARFDEWTEIDSWMEGHFLEKFARGAFEKTFSERGSSIRPIFQHGRDPVAGNKPLGPIEDMREEKDGAWADVPLLDADYVRQIVPGLEAGLYGASFAFQPLRKEIVEQPGRSKHNPLGIPEHTVVEARVKEFGPVTFPAYASTSAGVRSLTDDMTFDRIMREDPERLRAILSQRSPERVERDEMEGDEERAPADEATPALAIARRRLLLMQRR